MEEIAKVANPFNAKRPDFDLTRTILRYDVNANIADTIHVTETPVARMSFPPTMDKIMLELVVGYGGSSVIRPRSWRIIDTTGLVLSETDINMWSYSFSPDGSQIAFISGIDVLETDFGFYTDGLGILNIADGAVEMIISNAGATREDYRSLPLDEYLWMRKVLWASDGQIYVVSHKFLHRLDVNGKSLVATTIPGEISIVTAFAISPDSKYLLAYYLDPNEAGRSVEVYDLQSEEALGALIDNSLGRQVSSASYNIQTDDSKWFGSDGARLIVKVRPRNKQRSEKTEAERNGPPRNIPLFDEPERQLIIDFNLGKVIYEESPVETDFFRIFPWQTWTGSLLVERNGKIINFPLSELQLGD